MPRILIADDNSNIQKMVALALKDAGIDVVAVPNGEAAIRKLSDAMPDLVLADIFMPVRSGYEVCEFIKHDPRYSQIPVVLLVGAFDPLDEREAQRVGADGILKKPFVPPDPLINMVKDLLAKSAGERLVAVAVPVSAPVAVPVAVSASSSSAPAESVAAAYPPRNVPDSPEADISPAIDFSDVPPEELAAPAGRMDFSDHEKPVAFSSLLETPAVDDADLILTASRDPILGEPAFWSQTPAAEEPSSTDDAIQDHTWGSHAQPLPLGVDGPVLPSVAHQTEQEAERGNEYEDLGESSPINVIEFAGGERAQAAAPSLSEIEQAFSDVAEVPEEAAVPPRLEVASALPETHEPLEILELPEVGEMAVHEIALPEIPKTPELNGQHWDAKPVADQEAGHPDPDSPVEELPAWLAAVTPIFPPLKPLVAPLVEPLAKSELESFPELYAVGPSAPERTEHNEQSIHDEYDGDAEPADQAAPAAAWDSSFEQEAVSSTAEILEVASPEVGSNHGSSEAAAVETQPASLASAASSPAENPAEPDSELLNSETPSREMPSPEMIEAIVTRIVQRMQPKVFEVVTRDILRPLVEALVRREIDKY